MLNNVVDKNCFSLVSNLVASYFSRTVSSSQTCTWSTLVILDTGVQYIIQVCDIIGCVSLQSLQEVTRTDVATIARDLWPQEGSPTPGRSRPIRRTSCSDFLFAAGGMRLKRVWLATPPWIEKHLVRLRRRFNYKISVADWERVSTLQSTLVSVS